jgi:hypothetical protein
LESAKDAKAASKNKFPFLMKNPGEISEEKRDVNFGCFLSNAKGKTF